MIRYRIKLSSDQKPAGVITNKTSILFLYLLSRSLAQFNPLSANPTKWSNTLKQFVGNCLSVFDHFVTLALKGLQTNGASIKNLSLKFLSTK